jgi:lysozyme
MRLPLAIRHTPGARRRSRRLSVALAAAGASALLLTAFAAAAGADPYGPDVANYQHPNGAPIAWSQVATEPDQHFAIIKATESTYYTNPYMASDAAQARAAGLTVGFYHFADPGSSPTAQADYFAGTIGRLTANELPPILDLEVTGQCGSASCSAAQIVSWTHAFLSRLQTDTGRTPMIYTDPGFWNTDVRSSAFSAYPLWLADYTYNPFAAPTAMPLGWSSYALWQYTDTASIPGIQGQTDRSTAQSSALLAKLADADPNAYFVAALAQNVLGSQLPLAQTAQVISLLDHNQLSRQSEALAVLRMPAHADALVKAAYLQVLRRLPAATELSASAGVLEASTVADMTAQLVGSTEFYRDAGATPARWVNAAFQTLLGHPAGTGGELTFTFLLAHGYSRTRLAEVLLASAEGLGRESAASWSSVFGSPANSSEVGLGQRQLGVDGNSTLAYQAWLFASAAYLGHAEQLGGY